MLNKPFLLTHKDIEDSKVSYACCRASLDKVRHQAQKLDNLMLYSNKMKLLDNASPYILDRISKREKQIRSNELSVNIKTAIISTFIRNLMNDHIDRRLVETLDYNSLVRVSLAHGGKNLEIPHYDKVEGLLANAYYAYLIIVEDCTKDQALSRTYKELGIQVSRKTSREDLARLALVFVKEMKDENSDMVKLFDSLLDVVSELQEKLRASLKDIKDAGQVLKVYSDVNRSFMILTKTLQKLG